MLQLILKLVALCMRCAFAVTLGLFRLALSIAFGCVRALTAGFVTIPGKRQKKAPTVEQLWQPPETTTAPARKPVPPRRSTHWID